MQPHVQSGALLDQHSISIFLALGYSLFLYVSKYHVRRNDTLPGGVLCNIPLDFVIRVPNILEIVLVLLIAQAIKTHVHRFGVFLKNSYVDYAF